jgi:23S rRNA U2552 (ribose-2'-O)-methylase RlmE/FtsJ
MSYYAFPRNDIHTYKNIELFFNDKNPAPVISNSLSFYLYDIKKKIDKQVKDWDIFKKYTNPYEYINTVVPNLKKCVSKNKYLSRSYFKMVEIIYTFDIRFFPAGRPILSFHLAEGPGGFIEALLDIRNCPCDNYIGMTILEDLNDPNIPGWKKSSSFMKKNKNVTIETGIDKTGDILSLDNYAYCAKKYASSMDFITADGGFDFSLDFNKQEMNMANLLFAQICFAVSMQKKNGCFVLKIFDCFMQHTVDLLYILSSFYDKTFIFKPNTSRFANSEKYIVCKGFLFDSNDSFYPFLYKAFKQMVSQQDQIIHRFLRIPLSYFFIVKLEEFNVFFGEKQIENIQYTLALIDNKNKQDKINMLVSSNIKKCINWCIKHNIEYNLM